MKVSGFMSSNRRRADSHGLGSQIRPIRQLLLLLLYWIQLWAQGSESRPLGGQTTAALLNLTLAWIQHISAVSKCVNLCCTCITTIIHLSTCSTSVWLHDKSKHTITLKSGNCFVTPSKPRDCKER